MAYHLPLSRKDRTFSFTPRDSDEVTIPWTPRQGKHWRGSVNLLAEQDYVETPGNQKKIFLAIEREALKNQGIRGEGCLITQQKYPRQYDVPLAVDHKKPTWMQVRNLNGKPVRIKKGEVVALHPRQGYESSSKDSSSRSGRSSTSSSSSSSSGTSSSSSSSSSSISINSRKSSDNDISRKRQEQEHLQSTSKLE